VPDRFPLGAAILLGFVLLAGSSLMYYVARLGERGRLPRSYFAGIRTLTTLSSDEAWNAAHRAAGSAMRSAAVGPAVSAFVVLARPGGGVGIAALFAGLAWLLGWLAVAVVRAQSAARRAG
jgi:SdpI/YfhL protein family